MPPRYVVPTDLLADILESRLALLRQELNDGDGGGGALNLVAERAAATLGARPASVLRALNRILGGRRTTATGAGLADALLLSLDVRIGDVLPTLPGTSGAACEMIETYYELRGKPESPSERAELARQLYRFGCGFLADVDQLALAA